MYRPHNTPLEWTGHHQFLIRDLHFLPATQGQRWEDHAKAVHLPSLCIFTLVGSCWYRGRRMCLPFLKLVFLPQRSQRSG